MTQVFVPQNEKNNRLRRRITNGKPALARWIGAVETEFGQIKVLAPLLAARAIEIQFDTGGSQRRVA
jgi:hypothetical protein